MLRKNLFLCFAFLLVCGLNANATTIRAFSTYDMVKEAQLVVRGQVVSQKSLWDGEFIYTETTVQVGETLAGRSVSPTVVVRQLGGTVDDVSLQVPGTAKLDVGREVLLFLKSGGRVHYLVGMAQGHYLIRKVRGQEIVTRDLGGLHLIDGRVPKRVTPRARPPRSPRVVTYAGFKNTIRNYAQPLRK